MVRGISRDLCPRNASRASLRTAYEDRLDITVTRLTRPLGRIPGRFIVPAFRRFGPSAEDEHLLGNRWMALRVSSC